MRVLKCDPEIEVIGTAMLSIIDNIQSDEIYPTLQKHDLTDIAADKWYPAQRWIDVMNDLAKQENATTNYIAIGMQVAENAIMPPQLQDADLPTLLKMWDVVYMKQHRGVAPGGKEVTQISDTHFNITLRDLYPDDMSYGVLHGWCRRFLPQGTRFTVKYVDRTNRRDEGGNDVTVIEVKW